MDEEQRQHLETLHRIYQKRVRILEQEEALMGPQTPPHVLIELDDLRKKIADIDAQLTGVKNRLAHIEAQIKEAKPSSPASVEKPDMAATRRTFWPQPSRRIIGIVAAMLVIAVVALIVRTGVWLYPASVGQPLFEENFSDPSALARNWEIHDAKGSIEGPSKWEIREGELWQTSNIYRSGPDEHVFFEGTNIVTKQGTDWRDYEFTVDFRTNGNDDGVGVLFHYQDEEHYYRLITLQDQNNKGPFRKLQIKDGDAFITLAETREGYDPSTTHKIAIRVVGENITIFFDGQQIFSVQDNHYISGRIGLQSYAEQPVFDNVKVFRISK
jgi:3-keto-disaccharide hydrolase